MIGFGEELWLEDGPTVPFLRVPYPTRMAVARLADGGLWVWSPIALTPELEKAIEAFGPVRHLVSPNKIHHLFLGEWQERWPEARLWASPGLAAKRSDLRFDGELGDEAPESWAEEIDQVVVRGSLAMEEVLFHHRRSRAALVCDLIQRHPPGGFSRPTRWLMALDGLLGEHGSTPREWRASFLRRGRAREAVRTALAWEPERLVIAHGTCAERGASAVMRRSLGWLKP